MNGHMEMSRRNTQDTVLRLYSFQHLKLAALMSAVVGLLTLAGSAQTVPLSLTGTNSTEAAIQASADPCAGPCVINYMSWPPLSYSLETASRPITALVGELASKPTLRLVLPGQPPEILTAADLKAIPHKTITFHNAHTNTDEIYSGVPLIDLLAKYGTPFGDKLHGKALSNYIVATGADGYKAVLALAEIDPTFHPGDVLVADTLAGNPIGEKDGPFRLIVTEDKRPARSVRNLVSIELKAAE